MSHNLKFYRRAIKTSEIKSVKPNHFYLKSASEDNTVLAEKEADIEENRYLETTSTCTSSHKVALHYK